MLIMNLTYMKIRRQIYLTTEQEEIISCISKELRMKKSEIIRRLIDLGISEREGKFINMKSWEKEMEILKNLDKSDLKMKEWKFNREELYED